MESEKSLGLVRLRDIIGCRKHGITPIVPISASVWWKWVRESKAPQPIKIGGSTFWYRDEVYAFVESWRKSRVG